MGDDAEWYMEYGPDGIPSWLDYYEESQETTSRKKNTSKRNNTARHSKKTSDSKKSSSKTKRTILVDGDNHFDTGKKGIERTKKDIDVRVMFSQPGAKKKFDKKYGDRPNVSSKLVAPGDQAVDNQIKSEAGRLLKSGNNDVTIVSQDKDFKEYSSRKKKENKRNRISTAKSVQEKINRTKK